jgi:hypothetical protein
MPPGIRRRPAATCSCPPCSGSAHPSSWTALGCATASPCSTWPGTGVVARSARDVVGPSGRVVGVDLNPAMLEVAQDVRPDLEWVQSDAEDLPFTDDEFNVALRQSALFFGTRAARLPRLHAWSFPVAWSRCRPTRPWLSNRHTVPSSSWLPGTPAPRLGSCSERTGPRATRRACAASPRRAGCRCWSHVRASGWPSSVCGRRRPYGDPGHAAGRAGYAGEKGGGDPDPTTRATPSYARIIADTEKLPAGYDGQAPIDQVPVPRPGRRRSAPILRMRRLAGEAASFAYSVSKAGRSLRAADACSTCDDSTGALRSRRRLRAVRFSAAPAVREWRLPAVADQHRPGVRARPVRGHCG